jgi:hypothetical protein
LDESSARLGLSEVLEQPPTRDDVITAYQAFLGREPESEAVIHEHVSSAKTNRDLIRTFASSPEFLDLARFGLDAPNSPLYHFNASIDVRGIIEAHVNHDRAPVPGHYVNFLGVAIPTRVMPHIEHKGDQLDNIPIPTNFHADMAEWAAVLRAVDLARRGFTMVELGCGWGCWMNNTGVAARARGLSIHVVGIEGDEKHLEFARETFEANRISHDEYTLFRGIAAATTGYALFPHRQDEDRWHAEPIFGVSEAESERAVAGGAYDRLKMIPLSELIGDRGKVDLVHMDIQGGEADLVEQTLELLSGTVAYLVIGTHSRSIEGRLIDILIEEGWVLEVERPGIFQIVNGRPVTTIDGVQGWRNPRIHPE